MSRIVGHLDIDYFYAQVEEVENPSLKGTPVLVCVYSGRTEESGVVSTANYRARELGVRSGMPIALAKKRLSNANATFVRMDHSKYEEYSDRLMDIMRDQVDVLEQAGIDEAYFDITKKASGSFAAATELARELKDKILVKEKLSCSVGIAPNKVIAKIASDFKKPNGLTVVKDTEAKAFVATLAVEKIYGVGPKTMKNLEERGINTVADLAKTPTEDLAELVGRSLAVYLHNAANGIDDEPVVERAAASQLSRVVTLKHDTGDPDRVVGELLPALKNLHEKLVAKGVFYRNVSVIGILKDLSLRSKGKTLETPTNDYMTLEKETRELFAALMSEVGELRRAGVRLGDLQSMVDQHSLTEFTG